jgi:DNA-binding beta-propeller fold protein YncE
LSGHNRVYAAEQTSGNVSVIEPEGKKLPGVIRLGDPAPGALSLLYHGELLVHGLGLGAWLPSRFKDSRGVSAASNSVKLIDTATNKLKIYVGRALPEAFFTPDGRVLSVTVRVED